jgi:hypothetical protein
MDEAPFASALVGRVVNRLTSMAGARRRSMTLRPMDEPGTELLREQEAGTAAWNGQQPGGKTKAANLAQNANNMSQSAATADRPPMTIPRDDEVAGSSCRAIMRTRAATVRGATVRP